jgi:intracellular sulfur oxidation DsrE/DsrF family protein
MNKAFVLAVAILLSSFFANAQQTAAEKAPHRVVIQLSSSDTLAWKGLMNNIKNLKVAWEDSVAIEVVVHGPGIGFLMKEKTTQIDRIIYFKSKGVEFVACENTLIERKITKESIIPEARFVKSAVVEIISRQEQGWSYIKSGF